MYKKLILGLCFVVTACTGIPDGMEPIQDFELKRYLGTWYEIARLDHSFESGLEQVSAHYSLKNDGGITVLNRGYSIANAEFEEAEGKAYFVREENEGYLKVSFFGPFYGSYIIFEIDTDNYQYAFVAGNNLKYLWLLSRTPTISDELVEHFIKSAQSYGFETDQLIFVNQN